MNYKIMKTVEDAEKCIAFAKEHELTIPENALVLFAEDDEGKVKGVIALKTVIMVEPLIGDNSMVANNLWRMAHGIALSKGADVVRANTEPKNKELYKKVGFEQIFEGQIIMEKEL